jgi:hypothetical protein
LPAARNTVVAIFQPEQRFLVSVKKTDILEWSKRRLLEALSLTCIVVSYMGTVHNWSELYPCPPTLVSSSEIIIRIFYPTLPHQASRKIRTCSNS